MMMNLLFAVSLHQHASEVFEGAITKAPFASVVIVFWQTWRFEQNWRWDLSGRSGIDMRVNLDLACRDGNSDCRLVTTDMEKLDFNCLSSSDFIFQHFDLLEQQLAALIQQDGADRSTQREDEHACSI